ncbi:hypothetical protein EVA_01079 [gut metagenome]|uniref:Uncharacterized protein n=1 Tax=gut metagenome TaxID=749906 RepID=J9H3F8_9ZZZZ
MTDYYVVFLKVFGVTNPIVNSGNDKGTSNKEKGGKGYLQETRVCRFFSVRFYQGVKDRHYEKQQDGNGKPCSVFILHGFQLFISHINDRFLHVRDVYDDVAKLNKKRSPLCLKL